MGGVMTALIPSVEAAVQAALLQMKQSSVSSSAFQAGQQTSGSTQVTGVTTVTETSISATEENALIARIIKVLTPSITTSVRKALALRVQSVSSNNLPPLDLLSRQPLELEELVQPLELVNSHP